MAISVVSLPDNVAHVGNEVAVVIDTTLLLSSANLKVKLGLLTKAELKLPWSPAFAQALANAQRDLQLPQILSAITQP